MPRVALIVLAFVLCATSSASAQTPRVVNGADVPEGELGWTVALVDGGRGGLSQFCGGTLVREDTVVTAAHCVEGQRSEDIDVLAGVTTLSKADPRAEAPAKFHPVASIAVHPDANLDSLDNDLAVLKLQTDVTDAPPIDVIEPTVFDGLFQQSPATRLRVSGWGLVDASTGVAADRLQYGDLDLIEDADCENAWDVDFDADTMVCALDPAPVVVDSCNGDSGGPLTTIGSDPMSGDGFALVGAVSFGSTSCENAALPGVYTRIGAPLIHKFVASAIDPDETNDPLPQPEHESGRPVLGGDTVEGATLTCGAGTAQFSGGDADDPVQVALSIRRMADGAVVGGSSYALTSVDVGHQFVCRATATVPGVGGSAIAQSFVSSPVRPAPVVVQVPGPTQQVPVPVPVPVPITPQPSDTASPRISRVSESCSRRRRTCRFTIRATDPQPSAGVKSVQATVITIVPRSCRKNGRKTVCRRTVTKTLRARRVSGDTFRVVTPRLRRGRHTLTLVAVDGAGNLQLRPHRRTFRVA